MRLAENVWNSEVIFAEIKAMGYTGGRSILRYYIQPKRKRHPSKRTVRFETESHYRLGLMAGYQESRYSFIRCCICIVQSPLTYPEAIAISL